jgi:hypothetical protein
MLGSVEKTNSVGISIQFPTPHDTIDSRASIQFARRPSFVSGKRGVTFFRAMFVDRSGVQIAVQQPPPFPTHRHTHWKSKRAAHRGENTLQGWATNKPTSSQKFYSTKKTCPPLRICSSKSGKNEDRFPQAAAILLSVCLFHP